MEQKHDISVKLQAFQKSLCDYSKELMRLFEWRHASNRNNQRE